MADDAQIALANAMQALAARLNNQHIEVVKIPLYDGTTDVEDFIALFNHLSDLYGWADDLRLAKLKTSLTGKAALCGTPGTRDAIFMAFRARFGITPAEAKRGLLSMKSGYTDRLRELADKIQKLTDLAYPGLAEDMRHVLALDQFKRCVSTDLSLFMVSRPPNTLDHAVQICNEYCAAGVSSKGKKMQISSAGFSSLAELEDDPEVTSFQMKALTRKDLQDTLQIFKDTMTTSVKTIITACAEAIKAEVQKPSQTFSPPQHAFTPTAQSRPKSTSYPSKKKVPPGPCVCGELHWYNECPKRELHQKKTNTDRSSMQGN